MIKIKSLKGRKQFQKVFSEGKRFFDKDAVAIVVFKKPDDFRLASDASNTDTFFTFFVPHISKKIAKKAVVRNRVKRLIRESCRSLVKKNKYRMHFASIDTIFLSWQMSAVHPKQIKLDSVLETVGTLLTKSYKYFLSIQKDGEIETNINISDKNL